jgi:hypothetical protein
VYNLFAKEQIMFKRISVLVLIVIGSAIFFVPSVSAQAPMINVRPSPQMEIPPATWPTGELSEFQRLTDSLGVSWVEVIHPRWPNAYALSKEWDALKAGTPSPTSTVVGAAATVAVMSTPMAPIATATPGGMGFTDSNCAAQVKFLENISDFNDTTLTTVWINATAGQILASPNCSTQFRFTNGGHSVNLQMGQMAIGWTASTADVFEATAARTVSMIGYDSIRILPMSRPLAEAWLIWAKSQGTANVATLTYK